MLEFDLRANNLAVAREVDAFGEKATGRAGARALNRAALAVRTAGSKATRQHLAVKARDVKPAFTLRRARGDHPVAIVSVSSKPLPLVLFPHKERAEGVAVQVLKGGSKKVARHTFVAKMPSGHVGVFLRRRGGVRRASRLPIDETVTKPVSQVLEDQARLRDLANVAEASYARELAHQLDLLRAR